MRTLHLHGRPLYNNGKILAHTAVLLRSSTVFRPNKLEYDAILIEDFGFN